MIARVRPRELPDEVRVPTPRTDRAGRLAAPAVPPPAPSGATREPVRIEVHGELDLATAPALRTCLAGVLSQRPAALVLDLSGCTFADCSALGPLLWARDRADRSGCRLVLSRPSEPVRRLLALTGLERAFMTEPS